MSRPVQTALAFCLSLLFLCGLVAWLQNVHIVTANGMYKSIQAELWIANPATARLDPSNYLYFPLYGALCRLLDAMNIDRGVPWRQFAWANAFFASLATATVYAFAHRVTGSARAAALTALFHLGCGFVLLLAVISEDIMPAYAAVLGAMALAALWFDRPTVRRVIAVGTLFTIGWLIEWRLLFPLLPALGLALMIAPVSLKRRAALVATLLVTILAVTGLVQLWSEQFQGPVGVHDLLWTGKGVATGWAGLGWDKAWMMLSGIGNYFLLVGGWVDPLSAQRAALPLLLSVALQGAILLVAVALWWDRRHAPRVRAIGAVFLGTLAAGQVLNFYSQPQDPQMQINVMPWLAVAWMLIVGARRQRSRAVVAVLALLSAAPLAWNVGALAQHRGGDRASLAALDALGKALPPEKTVFVYWGFEPITMWQYALWSRTWDWDGKGPMPPAPSRDPAFKWIAIDAGAIRHPDWSPEQNAEILKRDIDQALDRGYRVAISDVWTWDEAELKGQLAGLSAANRAGPIWKMLHDGYVAAPVFTNPVTGGYYELKRR